MEIVSQRFLTKVSKALASLFQKHQVRSLVLLNDLSMTKIDFETKANCVIAPADFDDVKNISLWADYILIAPATANTISKISFGLSDDLASSK